MIDMLIMNSVQFPDQEHPPITDQKFSLENVLTKTIHGSLSKENL